MIKHPQRFTEASPANFNGIFDWDFLLPAFEGTKIEPMDIDAVVERHGQILLFETKSPGKAIPLGQEITLKTLLQIGRGRIKLFVLYGKTPETIVKMEEWYYDNNGINIKSIDCNAHFILKRVKSWFQWANNLGRLL
jgi:hypothetical protein